MALRLYSSDVQRINRDSAWIIVSTTVPVALLVLFAIIHFRFWQRSGEITGLGMALQECVLITLFLIRRRPIESTNSISAWTAAIIGSYGVLLLRPTGNVVLGLHEVYAALQFVGAGLTIFAVVFLGRSFGIVAANRGVKTDGAYRIVRHPIYASYLVGSVAYILAAVSVWNAAVIAVSFAFQLRRIRAEEAILMRDPEYRAYAERVRFRLIPYVY